ncbi:MAG: Crp/Fnr family transcriptional regulator [Bacteroidota bacterium]
MLHQNYNDLFHSSLEKYTPISKATFSELLTISTLKPTEKGEFLLHTGQTARKIYFICEGIVTSLFITQEGGTHIKNFFLAGNFAASTVSAMLSVPSSFSLEILEGGFIFELDFKRYKQLILENEELKLFYIAYVEQKWIIENERRQISFATQTATERYLTFLKEYPTLEDRVTQHHIASYLGVTPTQLSRIRRGL